MKAPALDYLRPGSVAQAVRMLDEYDGQARVLSGGQSLVPMLNMRLMRPMAVVDIAGLAAELGTIDGRGAGVTLGALVRYRDLETSPVIAERLPVLRHVVGYVGDRQVRNRGTVGGALAQSDPTGELALAALALGARITATSVAGTRTIAAEEFFTGSYANALAANELLVSVEVPAPPGTFAFFELGRKHNDFAVVSVLVVGTAREDGGWADVRVALGGAAERPLLVPGAARLLEEGPWTAERLDAAVALVLADIDPADDVRASAAYRRRLVEVHTRRTLERLARGGTGG